MYVVPFNCVYDADLEDTGNFFKGILKERFFALICCENLVIAIVLAFI
jgi:hypothetical protein